MTLVIMIIIGSTAIELGLENLETRKITNLYADLKSLKDQISIYYSKYGEIPIKDKFLGSYKFVEVANPNDDDEQYYIIDIEKIKDTPLVRKITWEYDDVYIINKKTHMIYYPQGLKIANETYYRLPGEYTKIEE